jgi:segregation and condensation protein B
MPPPRLEPAIEALLFSSDQPLPLTLLSEALEAPAEELTAALHNLGREYAERGAGVELREIAGGWMVVTTTEQAEWVGRMLRGKRRMRLSRAALETMAIIAYKQPVTKSEVEAIRGVDSSGVLATLLERNLVTIRGRSKVVGRPLLYGTTQEFLEYFGLRDLGELPRPEELRALVAAREPEQLDLMELEVVSQVASDLAAGEASGQSAAHHHEIEPLDADELMAQGEDEVAEEVFAEDDSGAATSDESILPVEEATFAAPAPRRGRRPTETRDDPPPFGVEPEAFTAPDADALVEDEGDDDEDAPAPADHKRSRTPS